MTAISARDDDRQRARRGLVIYLAIVIVTSALLEAKIIALGESVSRVPLLIVVLMYMPAAASIVARLLLREGFADISLRTGGAEGRRTARLAWAYPVAVGFIAYGVAWATGLAEFQRPLPTTSHWYAESAVANFAGSFLLSATLGSVVSCATAFGEELGWRGYMLTRLISAGVPRPVLVSGVIWALWHVPLILSGQYAAGAHPWLSALLFVIGVVSMAYLAAYVRLQSGSVWPAVIQHGVWNAIIQGTFDRATVDTPLAVGESGWMTTIVSIVYVLLVTRDVWRLHRRPGERFTLPSGQPASVRNL